jgi:hypothetical protein
VKALSKKLKLVLGLLLGLVPVAVWLKNYQKQEEDFNSLWNEASDNVT